MKAVDPMERVVGTSRCSFRSSLSTNLQADQQYNLWNSALCLPEHALRTPFRCQMLLFFTLFAIGVRASIIAALTKSAILLDAFITTL